MQALQMGQVEELLITAVPQAVKPLQTFPDDAAAEPAVLATSAVNSPDEKQARMSDELVTRAQQTAARVRMIENADLLREYGGVAATLRFRI
jgi:peptide subunit release factor 1 (eRF1)